MGRIRAYLAAFRRDESGSIAVESMLMIPVLIWCYLGTFVFFDAFRAQSTNIKASYTIGDTLSRETGYITTNYMNSLYALQGLLLQTTEPRGLQVTVYTYNSTTNAYTVKWSRGLGGLTAMNNTQLTAIRAILPVMPNGEIAILTRSQVHYTPDYEVGIDPFTFDEYTVTRPRFAPQLCWNTVENGNANTATC